MIKKSLDYFSAINAKNKHICSWGLKQQLNIDSKAQAHIKKNSFHINIQTTLFSPLNSSVTKLQSHAGCV